MRLPRTITQAVLPVALTAALVGALSVASSGANAEMDTEPRRSITATDAASKANTAQVKAVGARKRTPAPTTVVGYRQMFDKVPVAQWGGADVSISTKLRDGRRVWLYGDTLSKNNGFVNSTALVQTGGTLRVSRGGKQILPSGKDSRGRKTLYWIEQARQQADGDLEITAAPVTVVGTGMFDFKRHETQSRIAEVAIDAAGDLTFKRWLRYIPRPLLTIDGEDARPASTGKWGHWYYSYVVHDIKLADGSWLMTHAQNWEDGFDKHRNANGSLRYKDWRPVFSSSRSFNLGITPDPSHV